MKTQWRQAACTKKIPEKNATRHGKKNCQNGGRHDHGKPHTKCDVASRNNTFTVYGGSMDCNRGRASQSTNEKKKEKKKSVQGHGVRRRFGVNFTWESHSKCCMQIEKTERSRRWAKNAWILFAYLKRCCLGIAIIRRFFAANAIVAHLINNSSTCTISFSFLFCSSLALTAPLHVTEPELHCFGWFVDPVFHWNENSM